MAGYLGAGTPIFEIRDVGGMTDMLISNNPLADGLAKTLGHGSVALMRVHGSVVVANSIQLAVWRAIYTEMNARVQTQTRPPRAHQFSHSKKPKKQPHEMTSRSCAPGTYGRRGSASSNRRSVSLSATAGMHSLPDCFIKQVA